ncbi:MAG TPA: sialidase family protein [Gemmatales bacterium]|nr:sialidase family protein [Gemmatales bacterium]
MTLQRTPNGGIQPQAVVDAQQTIHLIYFKGEAKAGDLYYVSRKTGETEFSKPIKVNSRPASAVAIGTVRGGQLALGKKGRVHVAWNGASGIGGMQYSRLSDTGDAFEPQRNLMQKSFLPDGGCSIAANESGQVLVAWHGVTTGQEGEDQRQMWAARSSDDGKTFTTEVPLWTNTTGACGCCSTRALSDEKNTYLLYRSATSGDGRDIYLLQSDDQQRTFNGALLDRWKINSCPMSTYALAMGPKGVVAAWDTKGQIYFTTLTGGLVKQPKLTAAPGTPNGRKHPAIAINSSGTMLLAWTEGTGWQRGGALAWQLYNANGQTIDIKGQKDAAIGVWGVPSAVAVGDGFILFH